MFFNITEETHGFESSNDIKPQHSAFGGLSLQTCYLFSVAFCHIQERACAFTALPTVMFR